MGLLLNGLKPLNIIYNGAEAVLYCNGSKIWPEAPPTPPDPNPLNLPAYTIRVKFKSGYTPAMGDTQTLVDSTNNVWDIYKASNNWTSLFSSNTNLLEVLGANSSNVINMYKMFYGCYYLTTVPLFDTSSVTNMYYMFRGCTSLSSVPLFDTSSVTDMSSMLYGCSLITTVPLFDTSSVTNMNMMFFSCGSLTSVPLFDTSSVTNMYKMFYNCYNLTTVPLFNTSNVTDIGSMFYGCTRVQSGALALYQQASSQATPPSAHSQTFYNCGSNTTTGAAELAQIPSDWK